MNKSYYLGLFLFVFFSLLLPWMSRAEVFDKGELYNLVESTGEVSFQNFLNVKLTLGRSFCRIDLGGDGISEIVFGAASGEKPLVSIFDQKGNLINQFLAYDENFKGGVEVSAQDLDWDGKGEIITGAGFGGGPHVRIFDGFGREKLSSGFYAFPRGYYKGIKVTGGNFFNDQGRELAVAGFIDKKIVIKFFDREGNDLNKDFSITGFNEDYLPDIVGLDLGNDGIDELVLGSGYGNKSVLRFYRVDGSIISEYPFGGDAFLGGVLVDGVDMNSDGRNEVLVSLGIGAGQEFYLIDAYRKEIAKIKKDSTWRGGAKAIFLLDKKDIKILLLPYRSVLKPEIQGHLIDIDLSEQIMRYYDFGVLLSEHRISTGRPGLATRQGNFKVLSKLTMAYGGTAGQSWKMPYWIGFYYAGATENGMHGLPYINGIKESSRSLGRPISHGCVRSSDYDQRKLYEWAQIGDQVVVHK